VPDGLTHRYTKTQIAKAWVPFLILSLFVFLWGYKPVKDWMNVHTTPAWVTADGKPNGGWTTPLHRKISRDKPVVPKPTPEGAKFPFIWLSATGTATRPRTRCSAVCNASLLSS
jgi:lactate permease